MKGTRRTFSLECTAGVCSLVLVVVLLIAGCGGSSSNPGDPCLSKTCDQVATCETRQGIAVCVCPDGYDDPMGDGSVCADVDECADGSHDCASDDLCQNTDGSFLCSVLDGLVPPLSFIRQGQISTTIPEPLTLWLAATSASDTSVVLNSSGPGLIVDDTVIPAGNLSMAVVVEGVTASATPYTVTANLDGVERSAQVLVLSPGQVPRLVDLVPDQASVSTGEHLELTVVLDIPAPTGGTLVTLALTGGGVIPPSVVVTEDQLEASFNFTAGGVAETVTVNAELDGDTFSSHIQIDESVSPHLVINEIDYDQPGSDVAEFVELYNAGASPVSLDGLTVITFNGSSNTEIERYDLSGTLGPGEFFLLANIGVAVPSGVASIMLPDISLQNGSPDGIAIFDTVEQEILDALCYEGQMDAVTITGFSGTFSLTEGTATLAEDSSSEEVSLIRHPNGQDTDNAIDDWYETSTPTPGEPNVLARCSDHAQCDDGDPCTAEVCDAGGACRTATLLCVDLRADVNRNGVVDLADPTEDADEDTWDATHGAVFLANIDDDEAVCPVVGGDAALAACNDAADNVVNGADDLFDLAEIRIAPWVGAPADASATVTVSAAAQGFVRLFIFDGSNYAEYTSGGTIGATALQAGVEMRIEALDFVRDDMVWDGTVDLTLDVQGGTGAHGPLPGASDTVRLRVAPVVFSHALDEVHTYFVTNLSSPGNVDFRNGLDTAAVAAGGPAVWNVFENDQWTQDFFQTAYMSMPAPGGRHAIRVGFRSANYTGSGPLRGAGRFVFTGFRGPDLVGVVLYDPNHADFMDTLNSFNNLMVIPPHANWPHGRVLRGGCFPGTCVSGTGGFFPDQNFDAMLAAQGADSANGIGLQDVVYIDTSWLLVGHIAETMKFVQASTPLGWIVLVADPTLAWDLLQSAQNDGHGNANMFIGKYWPGNTPAQVSINAVLSDPGIANTNVMAAARIDDQITALVSATGISSSDIVRVPALYREVSGLAVHYLPNMVDGLVLADDAFAAPDPHGPQINGQDLFKQYLADTLGAYNINVYWVENWDLYHRLYGSVGSGTNDLRELPAGVYWWESGL